MDSFGKNGRLNLKFEWKFTVCSLISKIAGLLSSYFYHFLYFTSIILQKTSIVQNLTFYPNLVNFLDAFYLSGAVLEF